MMRIRGSVPEARTTMRPVSFSRASASAMAAFTCWVSSGWPPAKRTFLRTCGAGSNWRARALSGLFDWASTASTCSAEIRPSPVVDTSDMMMWPDCSPPRLKPPSRIRSMT